MSNNITKLAQEFKKRNNPTTTSLDMCLGQVISLEPLTLRMAPGVHAVYGKNLIATLGFNNLKMAMHLNVGDSVLAIPHNHGFAAIDLIDKKEIVIPEEESE